MALDDYNGFDINRIEVFANYSRPDTVPSLEDAYQGLLDQRKNKIISVSENIPDVSEDDLLLNKNLQTSALFNRLNDEFKQKQLKLDDYNEQLKNIHDTPGKIETHMEVIKNIYMSNKVMNVDILNGLNDQVKKFFRDVNSETSDIIRQKIMELEGEIENISRKLISLRSLILTGVNEIIKPENTEKKMCSVCFDNEINTALVPCGHTFCKGCSEIDRSRYAKCPQCRQQINARIKIYFSI
jgi:hypothetical protein